MEKTYLFPAACKKAGLWMFIPFAVLGLNEMEVFNWLDIRWKVPVFALVSDQTLGTSSYFFNVLHMDIVLTLAIFGLVVSLLLFCFSSEKDEDEYVANLRCRTLVTSVVISYTILLIGNLFIYKYSFFTFMCFNMFTVLIVYAIMFNYRLHKFRKSVRDEE